MSDTPTTEQTPLASMEQKIKGDGPLHLDADEADELRASLRAVFARDNQLLLEVARLQATDKVNRCMGEALQRQGFVMKSVLNPDGTPGWDLQTKADAEANVDAETVN